MKKLLSFVLAVMLCLSGCMIVSAEEDEQPITVDHFAISDFGVEKISQTSVKFSWYLMSYSEFKANGFELYTYNSADGSCRVIADIKASADKSDYSYTVVNLKKAKKYIFTARAYADTAAGRYYTDYTDKVFVCTSPSETKIKSVKYLSTGKVKLTWSKVANISGYLIEYSPSKSFPDDGRTSYIRASAKTTEKTVSGLINKQYYFRIRTFINYEGNSFCSDYCNVKSVKLKKTATVKQSLNAIKSTTSGRKYIKEYTDGGVDIAKYNTTYDRVKAIYNWHSKNHKKYGWSCVGCNTNFNICLAFLFMDSGKTYDPFINLYAGVFKNSNGTDAEHKWSVIYLAGVPYIVDPRLQGYTSEKTGNTYFFIKKNSAVGKKYVQRESWGFFPITFDRNIGYDRYVPYYSFNFVSAIKKPTKVKATLKAGKGSVKVSWKKVNYIAGYQLQYSTKDDFKNAKTIEIDDAAALTKTVKGLKSKKDYYIRMRAYKKIGNNRIYGFWNKKQKIKTK